MDIVMITRDRPELTEQTIRSMISNATDWSKHRLVVVYDGPAEEMERVFKIQTQEKHEEITQWVSRYDRDPNRSLFRYVCTGKQLGVGGAKNFGACWLFAQPKPYKSLAPLVMFSDNDMYYLPGWDAEFEEVMRAEHLHETDHIDRPGVTQFVRQLGGWRHPFHRPGAQIGQAGIGRRLYREVDAVTGNCFVMRWGDWLTYGPFDANALGPGQSEDYALSQRVRAGGGLVATLDPPVAIHCGLVNSEGEPATGWRECEEMITQQLAGLSPEMRDDVVILRPSPLYALAARVVDIGVDEVNSAFEDARRELDMDPRDAKDTRPIGVNVGSGQRRFESTREVRWVNADSQSVPPDRVPDIVCDVGRERLPFNNAQVQYVVLHQVLEHFGCGESAAMLQECWRVLAPGGSLIITVPDMRALAGRWLGGEMDTQLFMTSVYGAYIGDEADRHKWGGDWRSWTGYLLSLNLMRSEPHPASARLPESSIVDRIDVEWLALIKAFDWREIPGASIARDWWILGIEVVKP